MAAQNRADLTAQFNQTSSGLFPDNNSREISPADLRAFVAAYIDSSPNILEDTYKSYMGTAGGTNTYTLVTTPTTSAYATGQRFYVKFTNANTGAATLNVNTLGAVSIVKQGASALVSGDISANQILVLLYDGTNFQIVGSSSSVGGGGTVESVTGDGVDNTDPDNPVLTFPTLQEAIQQGGNITTPVVVNVSGAVTIQSDSDNDLYLAAGEDAIVVSIPDAQLQFDRLTDDVKFTDARASQKGIEYGGSGYVTQLHSLTDKEYVDGAINTAVTGNASQTVSGKVEMATTAEAKSGATTGGTGSELAIRPDVLREKLRANRTVTGTDAIVQLDSEGLIYFNSALAFNFTIDQLIIDSYTSFINIGAGTVTFINGTGVTISGATTLKQGQSGAVFYRSATAPLITVSAEVVGLQDLYIPASSMYPRTSNGCAAIAQSEIATSLVNILTLDFDQTTQEFAQFTLSLPRNWNNGTVTAKFYWTAAAGTAAQGVVWAISGGAYSDDDALTAALGTAQTVTDALIATNDMHITSATSAITLAGSPADADFLAFQISRNPADGSDTLAADAKLIGVVLTITTDAAVAG